MADSSSEAVPAGTPEKTSDVAPSAPSTGETKGVETSYLDRVTAALGEGSAESPAAGAGKENETPPGTTTETKKADDLGPDDSETGTYPRTAQGRIRYLNDQVKAKAADVERLSASAKLSEQLTDYMEQKGIAPDELENTLALTALIKSGNFEQALKVLDPIYRELHTRVGNVLPADLEQKVKLGHITRADALELNRARATAKNVAAQTTQERQRSEAKARATEHQATVASSSNAVSAWETAKAQSDPDWSRKQPLMEREVKVATQDWVRANKRFPNAKEAVDIAETALKTVTAQIKSFAPAPAAKTVPQGDGTSPRSQAKPRSYMEAIDMALARAA